MVFQSYQSNPEFHEIPHASNPGLYVGTVFFFLLFWSFLIFLSCSSQLHVFSPTKRKIGDDSVSRNKRAPPYNAKPLHRRDHFGWMTELGVYIGELAEEKLLVEEEVVGGLMQCQRLLSLLCDQVDSSESVFGKIVSFLLLDFHVLLLYEHGIMIISRLRDSILFRGYLEVIFFNLL